MHYYINKYLTLSSDELTLNEINIQLSKEIAIFLYDHRGEKISIKDIDISEEDLNTLLDFAILSEIENYYNLIPNLDYNFFGLESKSLLIDVLEKNKTVGIISIPYYQGVYKHNISVDSIPELKMQSLKICNPNDGHWIGKKRISKGNRMIYDYGFLGIDFKAEMLNQIKSLSYQISKSKIIPIYIGGDHSITYPIIFGLSKYYGRTINLIYLDAHSDLSPNKIGELTNGNVLTHIIEKCNVNVFHYGLRGAVTNDELSSLSKINYFLTIDAIKERLRKISGLCYISVDVDVFDPSIIPATTYKVNEGLKLSDFYELIECLNNSTILGIDFVEYNVCLDHNYSGASALCNLLYFMSKVLSNIS